MTRYFTLHADNPQSRLINQAADALQKGAVVVYPTDSCYALGCTIQNRAGVETIRTLRKLQPKHPLTLICGSISQASNFAVMSNQAYRYFKQLLPGPYTFVLPATKNVIKMVQGAKRKEIGIRIPNHPVPLALVDTLEEPILSSTLWLPGAETPISDPSDIPSTVLSKVNLVLDAGNVSGLPTTVVEMLGESTNIIREGAGDSTPFQV